MEGDCYEPETLAFLLLNIMKLEIILKNVEKSKKVQVFRRNGNFLNK
jgi:hypothetical protein